MFLFCTSKSNSSCRFWSNCIQWFHLLKVLKFLFKKTYMRFVQLTEGSEKGLARNYLFDQSAKCDLTSAIMTESKEIIHRGSDQWPEDWRDYLWDIQSPKEQTIKGINIQQWSSIDLLFQGRQERNAHLKRWLFSLLAILAGSLKNWKGR